MKTKAVLKSLIFGIAFIFFTENLNAQVVNMESRRIKTDTLGWSGSVEGLLKTTKKKSLIFDGEFASVIQHKRKKDEYMFVLEYDLLKEANKNLKRQLMVHLRNTHQLTQTFSLEAFLQYQNDEATKMKHRFLAGGGGRLRLAQSERFSAYLGIALMYEYDEEDVEPVIYKNEIRNSSYFSFTYTPAPFVSLISTTFYQPRLDNFSDFRILTQETLAFNVTKNFDIIFNLDFLYNTTPVVGVPKSTFEFKSGFKYKFI